MLARFAAGDAQAFVSFYRLHLPAVVGWMLRRTGEPELAADLAAETFCAALLAAPGYRGEAPAVAWLFGIAAHKLADSRRQGVVEARARLKLGLPPMQMDDEDMARVEELASMASSEPVLGAALDSLPPAHREAVLARVVEERRYDEIAERMQCSEMLVRQRVARGLRALRGHLGEKS